MDRKNCNVLVVDDNPMDRSLVVAALKKMGFERIQDAEDGQIATFKIKNVISSGNMFHLILADWNMPTVNGLVVLQTIRSDYKGKTVKFIVLTGAADQDKVEKAKANGVTDFIVKPWKYELLEQKLVSHGF